MSDSDSSPKENILKIMDDFLSHLNRTKKLFMVLIFASFIIAPLSLVLAAFILTPQFAMQAGQPYDVAVSFVGTPTPAAQIDMTNLNKSGVVMGNFTVFNAPISHHFEAIPYGQSDIIVFRNEGNLENQTEWVLSEPAIQFQYVPAGSVQMEPFFVSPAQPRFMYIGDSEQFGRQTDVTTLVVIVVAVSAALAITWLILGIKEFRFFSRWNRRYSNYKKLQDELDRDLQD